MFRKLLFLLPSVVLVACDFELAGPHSELDGLPEGLEVRLAVEPGEVSPHAPFTVHFSATNTTPDSIYLVTSHGCLVIPAVLRNGKRIPFRGSGWACTAAITTHTFAPGETRKIAWQMRAELYAENSGDRDGVPAPKGNYIVQAAFETRAIDDSGRTPVVEASLRVR
jgi:hypothetical protein